MMAGSPTVNTYQDRPLPARAAPAKVVFKAGPFTVASADRAEITGNIGSDAPEHFETLLARYPRIWRFDFTECTGTDDDRATLKLGAMLREAKMNTHIPANGYAASGCVDLFMAGVKRSAEPGAEFLVHSWMDDIGLEPRDYEPDHPVHQKYIDYYIAMGMPKSLALSFYALTNSVPNDEQLRLTSEQVSKYLIR